MNIRLTGKTKYIILERVFFGVMLLLIASPITSLQWFVTEDGASHSYNAGVLYNLLSGNDGFLGQYYKINMLPSPNWLGHLLLAYTGQWFGAAAGAKIVHLSYVVGFPLAFRRLMFTLSPQPRLMSYLAFPVIYNVVFLFGFYNYCLGMVLMILVMQVWLRFVSKPGWTGALWLTCLLTLLWFSHQLTWGYAGLFILCHLLYLLISKKPFRDVCKAGLIALAASIPSLIFLIIYMVNGGGNAVAKYTTVATRWNYFSNGRLFRLHHEHEDTIGTSFLWLLLAIVVFGSMRLYLLRNSYTKEKFRQRIFWLIMFGITLLLMLYMPESIGLGGIIGIRVVWVALVFLIIFAAQFRLSSRAAVAAGTISVMLSLLHISYFRSEISRYNFDAYAAQEAGKYIRDKSTILILPFTSDWLHLHVGQYAVAGREVVLLDNYEAQHNYFPLIWDYEKLPYNYKVASLSWSEVNCTWYWPEMKNKPVRQVDYVMIVGDLKEERDTVCRNRIRYALDSLDYKAVFKEREITLYEYMPD